MSFFVPSAGNQQEWSQEESSTTGGDVVFCVSNR